MNALPINRHFLFGVFIEILGCAVGFLLGIYIERDSHKRETLQWSGQKSYEGMTAAFENGQWIIYSSNSIYAGPASQQSNRPKREPHLLERGYDIDERLHISSNIEEIVWEAPDGHRIQIRWYGDLLAFERMDLLETLRYAPGHLPVQVYQRFTTNTDSAGHEFWHKSSTKEQ